MRYINIFVSLLIVTFARPKSHIKVPHYPRDSCCAVFGQFFFISSNVSVIFVLLRVLYSQRLKKRQIHLSTKKSKQTVLKLVVPERTFLWPIILIDVTMKKDNFATSMVLNFERLWLMYLRSLWFYENFLFYFCPIHE